MAQAPTISSTATPATGGILRLLHTAGLPAALFVAALALYTSLGSDTFSGDDLQYATVIEQATRGGFFYHPAGEQPVIAVADRQPEHTRPRAPAINIRYPAEWPTSIAVVMLWRAFGWQDGPIEPVLRFRALVGALGVVSAYAAFLALGERRLIAMLAAIGLGTSVAYWTYSTHLDQTITMVALTSVALYGLIRFVQTGRRPFGLLMAGVLGLATLYNLTALITAVVFGAGIAGAQSSTHRQRVLRVGEVTLTYAAVILVGGLIALSFSGLPVAPTSPEFWQRARFAGHPEYHVDVARDSIRAVIGMGKSLVELPGAGGSLQAYWNTAGRDQQLRLVGFYGLVGIILALPPVYLLRRWRALQPARRHLVGVLLAWLLAYAGFNVWWDPGYIKYWLLPLLAWWALFTIALAELHRQAGRLRVAVMVAATVLVVGLTVNQTASRIMAAPDPWLTTAHTLRERVGSPDALFISPGHPLDFYIAYFTRRDVVAASLIQYGSGGQPDTLHQRITERAALYHALGAPVYVYGLETLSADEQRHLTSLLPGRLGEAWRSQELTVHRVLP